MHTPTPGCPGDRPCDCPPAPTGLMPRAGDRRKSHQRSADKDLHLARELIIEQVRSLVAIQMPHDVEERLRHLRMLVEVLETKERAVAAHR